MPMNMGSTLFFWFLILSLWGQCHNAHNITKLQHCFACYSCNRVELSQSIECPKEQNMCMVCTKVVPPPKLNFFSLHSHFQTIELIAGNIMNRRCANLKKCQEGLYQSI